MKNYRLIIEGPDMIGKSTAIAQLIADHKTEYGEDLRMHHCGLDESKWSFDEWIHFAVSNEFDVIDRCFVSEPLYGHVIRGHSNLEPSQFQTLAGVMVSRGFRFVIGFCDPEDYERLVEDRYDSDREAFTKQELYAVNRMYMHMSHSNAMGYQIPLSHQFVKFVRVGCDADGHMGYLQLDARTENSFNFVPQNGGVPKSTGEGDRYLHMSKMLSSAHNLVTRMEAVHDRNPTSIPTRIDLRNMRTTVDQLNHLLADLEIDKGIR